MKKALKSVLIITFALIMAHSSLVLVAAETTTSPDNNLSTTISADDNSIKGFELVWKFKTQGGHLYKRRWNATLGMWYDPSWILVY